MIRDFFRKLVTEPDNATPCPVRIVSLGAGTVYHGLIAFMVAVQHQALTFDMLGQYLQHMTLLGTALGVGIGAKSVMKGDAS